MTTDGKRAINRSVQVQPDYEQHPGSSLILMLASFADDIEPWGRNPARRDWQLRNFWPTEPILASAIYNIAIRNAAFSWTLEGPPLTVTAVQRMLHRADLGEGWLTFITKLEIDVLTQDNGGFIEVIRETSSATSAPLGIGHLDSGRCRRTGVREWPVVYVDRFGTEHRLEPHQVITVEEFPSPIETMNGVQICAVSRVLRAAQLLKDISIFQREKVSGSNPQAIHLISGVKTAEITDAVAEHKQNQYSQGFIRYLKPLIFSALDPTQTVSHEQIDLATLPDGFNLDELMRWYINQLALGFGADYQDFAPLPGRALGSSTQSLVLHEKSRGKGPAMFMKTMEHLLNFHGVIPQNVTFNYNEQDLAADLEQAEIKRTRAETDKIYVETGVLTTEAVRQQMLDRGDLSQEEFDVLQETEDVTDDVTVPDDERLQNKGKNQANNGLKQEEAVSDFAEEDRLELERILARDMEKPLRDTFRELRGAILGQKVLGLFGRKQDVPFEDLPQDPEFLQEFRVRMIGAMAPNVRRIAQEAAQVNLDLGLAIDMDRINQEILEFSQTYTNQWYQGIEERTRTGLRTAINTWQESGLGARGLPDLVDSIEPLFGKARAERIAATEVTRIFDEGNKLAHLAAGITTEEWQTARDELVDDICRELDGQRFPTDAGPRPVSDTHVNCRCARLPVSDTGTTIGGR